jgi:DNA end-binding protein Ku
MRAIWSGSLSFGLINIPVKLYSAAEERSLNFDLLDKATHRPIGYARVIRGTHQEVKWENIVKGYKYRNGDYIVLLDEDFKRASPKQTQTIDIISFTAEAEIDPKYYEKPYYLEPDTKATKAYALLREALAKAGKVALASFVLRQREHLAAVKPSGNALVLEQLRYDQDIRSTKGLELPGKEQLKRGELDMALQLIDHLSAHFKPEQFKDTYSDELLQIIEAKAQGRRPRGKTPASPEQTTDSDDLLAILRESLEQGPQGAGAVSGRSRASATTEPAAKPSRPASARRGPAREPAAKAAAAKPSARTRARSGAAVSPNGHPAHTRKKP